MRTLVIAAFAALSTAAPLAAHARSGTYGQAPAASSDPEKRDLRAFFQMRCAGCHGADGSATRDGRKLKGQDFTDAKDMKELTDAKMVNTIQNGLFFGKRMPAYKDQLTEAESLRMVQEVLRHAEKGKVIAGEAK